MPPIKSVLFDCDNTLVLSEALAFEACAELSNELLEKYGKPERFTGNQLLQTFVGQNFRGMMMGLQEKYDFKMPEDELNDYVERELGAVIKKLDAAAEPCEGVMEQLEWCKKKYPGENEMVVVSSSAKSRVLASMKKAGVMGYFTEENVYSAASSLEKPTSKPNPAIYHFACKKIGIPEGSCVAIEDSRSGATAAKNAKIPLIGYVGPYYDEGEEKVKSSEKMLREECGAIYVMHNWSEFPEALKAVEAAPAPE